ncbi:TM2 domain-containing protein [Mucilaginibacter terrenus]|uniref:TM2 domain-containing protein n=1 Tax=Mucilaginibacter terrenus TaxID=2482727 RepID=A0A3E2NP17_9SPHI|nr:TM2 domain-containing protein [Mucilaginibacter terrenus]RFZ82727.1 TM2 domain-containing protein [Mucilaginibacter terrenus]
METYNNPYMGFPDMTPEEMNYVQQTVSGLNDKQRQYFYMVYTGKRKSVQDMLIFSLVGLFVVPGLQRFVTGQIGMGLLYLFTIGLCFVGSIMDLINHKSLANEYNQKMAYESFQITKMAVA